MIVDAVQQRDDGIVGVRPLYLVGVPLVKAELAVSGCVVRMVLATLVLLVLHKIQISVEAVEGVLEEERHQTVSPGVRAKHVKHSQFGTTVTNPGQELELKLGDEGIKLRKSLCKPHLESCLAVKFTLNIILESELGQFVELPSLHSVVIIIKSLNNNHHYQTLGWMSLNSIRRSTAIPLRSGVS